MELTSMKKDIINHIIAEHEGRRWGSKTAKYLRALSGEFSQDMSFTIYFVNEVRPIMYVNDARGGKDRSSREVFQRECEVRKEKLRRIIACYEELERGGYVEMEYRGLVGRPRLPEQYYEGWRKYSNFYQDMMEGLRYVCLSKFEPSNKLYEVWEGMRN
jgi:hypothetical protein